LRTIFCTSDALRTLLGRDVEPLVSDIIRAMRPKRVSSGEVVFRQGEIGDRVYIVDDGRLQCTLGRLDAGGVEKVCEYGPGSVFGERALVSREPRAATVTAVCDSWLWSLSRDVYASLVPCEGPEGIGELGSCALLAGLLLGQSSIATTAPRIAEAVGWLPFLGLNLAAGGLASACGLLMLRAMQRMPGSRHKMFCFINLSRFYLASDLYSIATACFLVNMVSRATICIVEAARVLDAAFAGAGGCAIALDLGDGRIVCGEPRFAADALVLPASMLGVAALVVPLGFQGLRRIAALQCFALSAIGSMVLMWVGLLAADPVVMRPVPAVAAGPTAWVPLLTDSMFTFALAGSLPAWANEKRRDVSATDAIRASVGFVVLLCFCVGVVGGVRLGPSPLPSPKGVLLERLSVSASPWGRASAVAFPFLLNISTIPTVCIVLRQSLVSAGLRNQKALAVSIGAPLVLAVLLHTRSGFDTVFALVGRGTSVVVNFVVPVLLDRLSERAQRDAKY